MKAYRNDKIHIIIALFSWLTLVAPCLGEETKVRHSGKPFEADKVILGEDSDLIDLVFIMYLKKSPPLLNKALIHKKYYKFLFNERTNSTVVRVSFNHDLIKLELDMRIKGGGGDFIIDKKSNTITSYTLSK